MGSGTLCNIALHSVLIYFSTQIPYFLDSGLYSWLEITGVYAQHTNYTCIDWIFIKD